MLSAVTENYLRRSGLDIKLNHGVDNMAMAMSLVASTRGLALMPAYAKNLLPWSVVSRPLEGEAPTIDLAVGYSKANTSPILKLFLSRLEELRAPCPKKRISLVTGINFFDWGEVKQLGSQRLMSAACVRLS